MPRPRDIPVIDTLIGFRAPADLDRHPTGVKESQRGERHPADYMYRSVPESADDDMDEMDVVADTLEVMDRNGVGVGLVSLTSPVAALAATAHSDRFVLANQVDATDVMGAVRQVRHDLTEHAIRAVSTFPAGTQPQLPIDAAAWYPIYAVCVELGLPVFVTAGVPGPRVPLAAQHVEAIDRVMYDFPELVMVLRHGAEPWTALAVKLMLKWPGLHYSTSGFAPKHYPSEIVDYANTRGAEKLVYAGYHPYGLELDRIFAELDDVPLRDHVWEPFLRGNAARILGLD